MNVVLFFAAVYALSGPSAEQPRGFKSMAECHKVLAQIPAVIGQHNASDSKDKLLNFAAACVEVKNAKPGLSM